MLEGRTKFTYPRKGKHVLNSFADDVAKTRRVVLQDFSHPLKKSRKSKSTALPRVPLLQLKQDLFQTVNVKKFIQTPLPSFPSPSVHVHARQVVDIVVVVVIVVVIVGIDNADYVDHCVDRDAGKGQKAERRKRRA